VGGKVAGVRRYFYTCPLDYAKWATLCGRLNSSWARCSNGRPLEEEEEIFTKYTSPSVPIPSQIISAHKLIDSCMQIYFIIASHLRLSLLSCLLPSDLLTTSLYEVLLSSMSDKFPTDFILLNLINLTFFQEQIFSLWRYSLWNFLQSSTKILPSIMSMGVPILLF
jgi:hypothetical protein